jgi:hypothetical protein
MYLTTIYPDITRLVVVPKRKCKTKKCKTQGTEAYNTAGKQNKAQ